jgi:hypothetical protein
MSLKLLTIRAVTAPGSANLAPDLKRKILKESFRWVTLNGLRSRKFGMTQLQNLMYPVCSQHFGKQARTAEEYFTKLGIEGIFPMKFLLAYGFRKHRNPTLGRSHFEKSFFYNHFHHYRLPGRRLSVSA